MLFKKALPSWRQAGPHRWVLYKRGPRKNPIRVSVTTDVLQDIRAMAANRKPIDQDLLWDLLAELTAVIPSYAPVYRIRDVFADEPGGAIELRVVTLPSEDAPLLIWELTYRDGHIELTTLWGGADERVGPFGNDAVFKKQIPKSSGLAGCIKPYLELLAERGVKADDPWLNP